MIAHLTKFPQDDTVVLFVHGDAAECQFVDPLDDEAKSVGLYAVAS